MNPSPTGSTPCVIQLWNTSPYVLADSKRKRLLMGSGVVQFVFGGFLLLPVLFVLSLTVPIAVVLLVWLTTTGLIGMTMSYYIRPTHDPVIDSTISPADRSQKKHALHAPKNILFKIYISFLFVGLLLAVTTVVIGAALVQHRTYHILPDSEFTRYDGDLQPSDQVMFGIATTVLGAWLATVEIIMILLAVHVLRKHYSAVSRAIERGQQQLVISTHAAELETDVMKRPDQFDEPFFPSKQHLPAVMTPLLLVRSEEDEKVQFRVDHDPERSEMKQPVTQDAYDKKSIC